jgi:hypothetical protein
LNDKQKLCGSGIIGMLLLFLSILVRPTTLLIPRPQVYDLISILGTIGLSIDISASILAILIFSIALGLLNLWLVSRLASIYTSVPWLVVLLFSTLPAFLVFHHSIGLASIGLALALSALLCIRSKYSRLASVFLIILSILSFREAIIALAISIAWYQYRKESLALLASGFQALALLIHLLYGMHPEPSNIIFELGGISGIPIIILLLSTAGLYLLWGARSKFYPVLGALLGTALLSFIDEGALLYVGVPLSFLSAASLLRFGKRDWDIPFLRSAIFIIVGFSLLMTGMSVATQLHGALPDTSLLEGVNYLISAPEGVVFTYSGYAPYVSTISGKPVIGRDARDLDNLEILHSYNVTRANELLTNLNITHILLTDAMREGIIWQNPDKGLEFTTLRNENFKKVFSGNGVTVYTRKP